MSVKETDSKIYHGVMVTKHGGSNTLLLYICIVIVEYAELDTVT